MNLQFGVCPQCKMEISKERLREEVVVCDHCGFTDQKGDKAIEEKIYRSFLRYSIVLMGLLIFGFIQAVNWDTYALGIIPLKVKQWTSIASTAELKEIAGVCREQRHWDCLEEALQQAYQKDHDSELELLAELGKVQYQRSKVNEAAKTLQLYFAQGGLSLDARYDFARSLSSAGQIDQASQIYEEILQAKPEVLQITVAQNYVKLLMDNSRYREAQDVIQDIRKLGSNASLFMDKELQELKQYVK